MLATPRYSHAHAVVRNGVFT